MLDVIPPTWTIPKIPAGQRIRVRQTIVGRSVKGLSYVEGEVISCEPEATGSWYAHGKNDRLWLLRVRLRKADGEITTLVLDHNTRVEYLP